MVNSLRAMADIIARMPRDMAPETTEGYEPYIHPHIIEGEEARSTLKILLRDFDTDGLRKQAEMLEADHRRGAAAPPEGEDRAEDHRAVPQHALLASKGQRGLDVHVGGDEARGAGSQMGPHPRRDRRLPADGARASRRRTSSPADRTITGPPNGSPSTEWTKSVETVVNLARIWVEKTLRIRRSPHPFSPLTSLGAYSMEQQQHHDRRAS